MVDFFKMLDGSGREPRQVQIDTLKFLQDNWDTHTTFALNLGVGVGKSYIARAVQLATGSHIITPSNYLIDQYKETYPKLNYLKGMSNYSCDSGISCYDKVKVLEQKACPDCEYHSRRQKAEEGVNSLLNPMSYKYLVNKKKKVIIFDEVHQASNMVLSLAGYTFHKSKFTLPIEARNELDVINWIRKTYDNINTLVDKAKEKDRLDILGKALSIQKALTPVHKALLTEPEKYYFKLNKKEGTLKVLPLFVPNSITEEFKLADKIILMSATLSHRDIDVFGKGKVTIFNPPSPIPIENRQVIYDPYEEMVNNSTDPEILLDHVKSALDKYRTDENTLIHIPYKWQERLKDLVPDEWITNNKTNKAEKIAEFKKEGGVFLASGCSEGVDFSGDECRLNLIPLITRPNITDDYVSKRMALEDGRRWYDSQTLIDTAQKIGRSTRGLTDWSTTVILDPMFSKVVYRNKHLVDKDTFINNIQWTKEKRCHSISIQQ